MLDFFVIAHSNYTVFFHNDGVTIKSAALHQSLQSSGEMCHGVTVALKMVLRVHTARSLTVITQMSGLQHTSCIVWDKLFVWLRNAHKVSLDTE